MSGGASAGDARVCEYFCEVGVRDRLIPTASSPTDADLYSATFEPSVLRRVPETDHPGTPFAPEVAMFCFAHGCRVVSPEEAAANAIPVVTSFVLTAADKSRLYGACIVWYEKLPAEVLRAFLDERDGDKTATQASNKAAGSADGAADHRAEGAAGAEGSESGEGAATTCADQPGAAAAIAPAHSARAGAPLPEVHAPEAICLLSRVAVFDALMEACRQLFRMRISCDGPIAPAELSALLGTPMPGFGLRTELPLGNVRIGVATPGANELPHTMAARDFLLLFEALDVGNVIMLWALLLSEQKVALQGKVPHVLTMAAETLSALLFPFSWQHVYIPILPARLLDILQAPVP